jgi:hypothetical protein
VQTTTEEVDLHDGMVAQRRRDIGTRRDDRGVEVRRE